MPEATCYQDRDWFFSAPKLKTVEEAILEKYNSKKDALGDHIFKNFTIIDGDSMTEVTAHGEGLLYGNKLSTDNSGSE